MSSMKASIVSSNIGSKVSSVHISTEEAIYEKPKNI
jgi:hypothetical protein